MLLQNFIIPTEKNLAKKIKSVYSSRCQVTLYQYYILWSSLNKIPVKNRRGSFKEVCRQNNPDSDHNLEDNSSDLLG